MTERSSHEGLQELLPAAALEILDGSDLQRVLDHIPGCEECTRLLGEYRDVAATLPVLLPDRQLDPNRSAAIRSRLMTRVRGEPRPMTLKPATIRTDPPAVRAISRPDRWTGWMGWMVAAGLAGLLLVHHSVHRPVAHGWLAAGVLTFVVIALGVYVRVQQSRMAALRNRLAAEESEERAPQEAGSGSRA